ncbi:MBL fold metallo-hydrolase [Marinicrinis sediminis]|uniref:MBL fold metallo-hydrolase n=1 Tax=Marinicrinis sediminis TaxID=1652465 RepID=A0ABW5RFL6_9BACL
MTTSIQIQTIPVAELARKVIAREPLTLVDVRPKERFDDWKIEGEGIRVLHMPHAELDASMAYFHQQLEKDALFYVICSKGKTSELATKRFMEEGFTGATSVEGGMAAWGEHIVPVHLADLAGNGALIQFVRIGKGCLSYMVVSNGEAALIDISRTIEPYEQALEQYQAELKAVLDTHLHADHISGGRRMAEQHHTRYYLPPRDADQVVFDYTPLEDQMTLHIGEVTIKALYSPGHTIGSTSFLIEDQYLLTGDILFIDSIGRPDLAGKASDWVDDLRTSLYERYKALAIYNRLEVLPAHFMTLHEMNADGSVRKLLRALFEENHGLNIEDAQTFRKTVTENLPPQPNSYEQIRQTNMGRMTPEEAEQSEMELGPNRCAVR